MNGIRCAHFGDEDTLKELWKLAFMDDDDTINAFFMNLYAPEQTYVMEYSEKIVSMAYVLPFCEKRYIYAVATHPDYRGRGFGKAVTLAAAGKEPAYLCPADDGLRHWYETKMGAQAVSFRGKMELPDMLQPISADEYCDRREELLRDVPHTKYSDGIMRFFCHSGQLYATPDGICAAENGTVRELLPCSGGNQPYVLQLNGAEPLYWGLTLE